jgi:hypothetical protein
MLSIEGRGRYEDLVGTSRYCRVGSLSDLGPEPAPEVMESALVVAGLTVLSSCASWASRTVWNDMSYKMDPSKQTGEGRGECGRGSQCSCPQQTGALRLEKESVSPPMEKV